jgi:uncharacterized protein (DUF362 family)
MNKKIDRREFMKKGSSAVICSGLSLHPWIRPNEDVANSPRIMEVSHSKAVLPGRKVDTNVVGKMLKQGIESLIGSKNPWENFIEPDERIGLKINTLGRPLLFTHMELIQAVIDELIAFGVKENNIIVWDRPQNQMEDCGFVMNLSSQGVRYMGANSIKGALDRTVSYKSEFDNQSDRRKGRIESYFYKIFTEECDKIINMPILKNHGLSGVTLCLKNLAFGLTENNSRFHGPEHIGKFISDVCGHALVREKVVLHILDGLEGCYHLGPQPKNLKAFFAPQKIWLGIDPVAIDAVGLEIIDAKRKEMGIQSVKRSRSRADHIELAAQRGLGESDLDRIKIDKIHLG